MAQGIGPEFKYQYHKKKKNPKKRPNNLKCPCQPEIVVWKRTFSLALTN
jgi:hypothetical protein